MKAIILAGGEGRRMFPFDRNRQKCFLPVGNVPNAVRQVNLLEKLGVQDIAVVTEHEAQWAHYCLRGRNVEIVPGKEDLGATLRSLSEPSPEVLVVYGDIYLTEADLAGMLVELPQDFSAAALLESESATFRKQDWICADVEQHRIRAFYGRPRPHYANARSGGVFRLKACLYRYFECAPPLFLNVPTGGMPSKGFWLENVLQTAIGDGEAAEARWARGPIVDLDFPWDLLQANQDCARQQTGALRDKEVLIGPGSEVGEGVVFKGAAIIGRNTVIRNGVIVGDGCIIGDDCVLEDYGKLLENTVVGNGCKVGFTAEIGGVLMDGVAAVHNCELYGIVGRNTDIGAGTSTAFLRFDDAPVAQRVDGKRYQHPLAKAAYLGDHSRTGVNSVLLPGALVGGNSCIGPGVVIGGRVEHGTLVQQEQALQQKPWGPHKYGW